MKTIFLAILLIATALPRAGAANGDAKACDKLLDPIGFITEAYSKLLSDSDHHFSDADLHQMLERKDVFHIDAAGASSKGHITETLLVLERYLSLTGHDNNGARERLLGVVEKHYQKRKSTRDNNIKTQSNRKDVPALIRLIKSALPAASSIAVTKANYLHVATGYGAEVLNPVTRTSIHNFETSAALAMTASRWPELLIREASQNNRIVAIERHSRRVQVWDGHSKQPSSDFVIYFSTKTNSRESYGGNENTIKNISVSHDGQFIGVTTFNGRALIWDIENNTRVLEFLEPQEIRSMSFTPDSQRAMAVASNGRVHSIDLRTKKSEELMPSNLGRGVVTFSSDGTTFAHFDTGSGLLSYVEIATGRTRSLVLGAAATVSEPAISQDNTTIAIAFTNRLLIYNIQSKKVVSMPTQWRGAHELHFSTDGSRLYSLAFDGAVHEWNVPQIFAEHANQ